MAEPEKFRTCQFCGAKVKLENMLEHKTEVHHRELRLSEAGAMAEDEVHAACDKAAELMMAGDPKKAVKLFENVLKVDPENFGAWHDMGLALADLGRDKEALNSFNRCIELNPNFARAWLSKGNFLHRVERKEDEAVKCYEEAIKRGPRIPQAWYNIGAIHAAKKNYDEALRCFDESTKLDEKYCPPWAAKAVVLMRCGKKEEGEECLRKAYELDPELAEDLTMMPLTPKIPDEVKKIMAENQELKSFIDCLCGWVTLLHENLILLKKLTDLIEEERELKKRLSYYEG